LTRSRLLLPVVLSALGLTACGGARNAITIPLEPRHSSGLDGVARLVRAGDGSRLTVRLEGRVARGTTAAIYRGPCRLLPTEPITPRVRVEGRSAELTVPADARSLADEAVALKRNGAVLACGTLPAAP